MTIPTGAFRADLQAWMASPAIGLCEYWADPVIQRRVGRMLVDAAKLSALVAQTSLEAAPPKVAESKTKLPTAFSDTKPVLKLVTKDRG